MRVLVVGVDDATHAAVAWRLAEAMAGACLLTAGVDVAVDRIEVEIVGWLDGEPIAWQRGDVRGLIGAPYDRPGWASRCLDPATGLWETFRLGRRAARRQRGRARAAARLERCTAAV